MFRGLLLAVLSCSAAACGGAHLGAGKGRWLHVQSEHFALYTDLPRAEAERKAEYLEILLDAYLQQQASFTEGGISRKLRWAIFESPAALQPYVPTGHGGSFTAQAPLEAWAASAATSRLGGRDDARWILQAHITYAAVERPPQWLVEGLSSYFETAHLKDGRFTFGAVPSDLQTKLGRQGLTPTASLLAAPEAHPYPFRPTAWLLVHFLMSERRDAFSLYQRELAAGHGHEASWQRAFPGLEPHTLDDLLRDYASEGRVARYEARVPERRHAVRVEPMSRADEHALEAVLAHACQGCGARMRTRADQALQTAVALDPFHLEANTLLLTEGGADDEALRRARALTGRHAESWLSWTLLSSVHARRQEPSEQLAAAERAMVLAPERSYPHLLASVAHAKIGHREEAMREAAAARRLEPSSVSARLAEARIFGLLGACRELQAAHEDLRALTRELRPREVDELRWMIARCADGSR